MKHVRLSILIIGLVGLMAACGLSAPIPTPVAAIEIPAPPTATAQPTETEVLVFEADKP